MKRYIQSASRAELIDEIEEFRFEDYDTNDAVVDNYFIEVSGLDPKTVDDSDRDEGFYTNYSTDEIKYVYDKVRGNK